MSLAAERPEFAPPPQRGTLRAVLLALFAHALLIALLTWGVSWRREAENDAVEAELWSSTVQQAAPRAVSPPTPTPPPPPVPTPAPPPPPPPPPPPQAVKPPEPTPTPRQPDIALEREKKLKEQKERERELEQQRVEQQKKLEAQKKAAQEKKEAEARKREEEEAERKKDEQKKLAEQKRKQEAEAKQQAEAAKKKEADAKQAAQVAKERQDQLRRLQALAGTGNEDSTGTAARSSGPSGGYAARIAGAIKRNITFDNQSVSGNPAAEFNVRTAPDGTIVGIQLTKSSGIPSWDEAAERGIRKTDRIPRDIDGRVVSSFPISLRPKD